MIYHPEAVASARQQMSSTEHTYDLGRWSKKEPWVAVNR
jgi:hypothetical protein